MVAMPEPSGGVWYLTTALGSLCTDLLGKIDDAF
jgi:hypothetical protein